MRACIQTQKVLDIFLVQPETRNSTSASHVINIGEIEAYDVNENKLTLTIDSYSSQETSYPVTNTIDGDPSTYGQTSSTDGYNWFKYTISGLSGVCSLKTVTIYNIDDSSYKYRIVGNYLQILENSLAINTFYFDEEKDVYNFTFLCDETGISPGLLAFLFVFLLFCVYCRVNEDKNVFVSCLFLMVIYFYFFY